MQRKAGWDAQAIKEVAAKFGGYPEMFAKLDWPERGSKMMISAPRHAVREFGSVEAFHQAMMDERQ